VGGKPEDLRLYLRKKYISEPEWQMKMAALNIKKDNKDFTFLKVTYKSVGFC